VAVTESFEIRSFFGPTDLYLQQPTGEARMELFGWAKPGLYPGLRPALEEARAGKQRVTVSDMRVERDGISHRVECTIEPITPVPGEARLFLVSFRDVPRPVTAEARSDADAGEPLARQLEGENKDLRAELQTALEQLDSTNEEYRASHEELLSLNEELQSNNEEVQASKEELQSLNEEMVTINRQLEEKNTELRAMSADLSNLLVSTDIPIIFLDRELRIRRFTPAATRLMRLAPADLGRSFEDIKGRFDDLSLLTDARNVLEKLVPMTTEVWTEDDRWYTRTIRPYRTEDDRIDGVCIAFFDITNIKRAASEHEDARRSAESFVEDSPVALLVLDGDMRVVVANNAFNELFQVPKGETEGTRLYDLGNRQWDIPRLRALMETILPERQEIRGYEVTHDFEQLGRRTMVLNARRMSRGDMPPYVLLSIEDLTERKELEDALRAHADDLAREHERRNEFLAMLGHELRNPLAALTHGIDLLGTARRNEKRREEVRLMMDRQARRVISMLDQLLDAARITAGKVAMNRQRIHLKDAVQAAVEAVTPLIESRHHKLKVSSSDHDTVNGDLWRLTQVVENLLSNAAKYMEEGGRIEVTTSSQDGWVRLCVRDNGIGIEPDLLPYIFELFAQGPRSLDRGEGGLGLGLPLAKKIVDMHGGKLSASSPGRGQGSEFMVSLPAVQARPAKSQPRRGKSPRRGRKPKSTPHRILVVDDQADVGEALVDVLEAGGHEVVRTLDGEAAIEAARSFRPDLALIDLGLPKMDGYELARRLRQERVGDELFLIALSGYGADVARLKDAGFDRHLIKPAVSDALTAAIADAEQKSRA
jgi:two-component system CheB/CheR fusion protein